MLAFFEIMKTDTPRTDKVVKGEWLKYEKLARELERENAHLRGATARLCRAVSRRMMPDEPTPEDRMELREAFDAASEFLHNA